MRCAGGQGDDGLAAHGHLGAAHKVQLTARTGIDALADGVGAHLAGEVYLGGRIDGYYLRIARNDPGVVGIGDVPHLDGGIVADEIVHSLRAQEEGGHHFSGVNGLAGAVNYTFLDER